MNIGLTYMMKIRSPIIPLASDPAHDFFFHVPDHVQYLFAFFGDRSRGVS